MQKQPTTVSEYWQYLLIPILFAALLYILWKINPVALPDFEQKREAQIKLLMDKQDSVLNRIAKYDAVLQSLAKQRDTLQLINSQLLQRQTSILSNIKTLQNEYSKIDKISLDRAAIFQFYIDSCKTYTPY